MKTKIKATTYIMPITILAFFVFCFIGMTLDETLVIYSWQWWLFGVVIAGLFLLFIISFLKIPKIEIANGIAFSKSYGHQQSIKINDITESERVISNINRWYSYRDGIKFYTDNGTLLFPFHIYSNESEILQRLFRSERKLINPSTEINFSNLSFIKYFYRNPYSCFLIPIVGFIYILQNKENTGTLGLIILSFIIILLSVVILKTTRYLEFHAGQLHYVNPLLLKRSMFDIDNIEHANSKIIATGKGGIRNLTIQLADKRMLSFKAGLNNQKSLDEIAIRLNTRQPSEDRRTKSLHRHDSDYHWA